MNSNRNAIALFLNFVTVRSSKTEVLQLMTSARKDSYMIFGIQDDTLRLDVMIEFMAKYTVVDGALGKSRTCFFR